MLNSNLKVLLMTRSFSFYLSFTLFLIVEPYEILHSRVKNPLKYETTSDVIILPQDYYFESNPSSPLPDIPLSVKGDTDENTKDDSLSLSSTEETTQIKFPRTKVSLNDDVYLHTISTLQKSLTNMNEDVTQNTRPIYNVIDDKQDLDFLEESDKRYLKFLNIHEFKEFNNYNSSTESFFLHRKSSENDNFTETITTDQSNILHVSIQSPIAFEDKQQLLSPTSQSTTYLFSPNVTHSLELHKRSTQDSYPDLKKTTETSKYIEKNNTTINIDDHLAILKSPRQITIVVFIPKDLAYLRNIPQQYNETAVAQVEDEIDYRKYYNLRQKPTKCYTCGLNDTDLSTTKCHDLFSHMSIQHISLRKKMRTTCTSTVYKGGCFKRYVDVGYTYYERGCRTFPPTKGLSYASKRLAKIEFLLKKHTTGCRFSPMASLTPFSKSISLFVRYHVCVCVGKYCNACSRSKIDFLLFLGLFSFWYLL